VLKFEIAVFALFLYINSKYKKYIFNKIFFI